MLQWKAQLLDSPSVVSGISVSIITSPEPATQEETLKEELSKWVSDVGVSGELIVLFTLTEVGGLTHCRCHLSMFGLWTM